MVSTARHARLGHMETMVHILGDQTHYLRAHQLRVSDPTGLLPALYNYTVLKHSAADARKQFHYNSKRFGFIASIHQMDLAKADFETYVAAHP